MNPTLLARLAAPPYLLALDIDGTVADFDGAVSPAVRGALDAVAATGSHVVLATGRGISGTLVAVRDLRLTEGWAVTSNGAITLRLDAAAPGGYEIADVVTFDPGPALRALRDRVPEALISIEDLTGFHRISAPFPHGILSGPWEVVDFDELCETEATRVSVYDPDGTREDFAGLIDLPDVHEVSYAVGWTAWLDLTPPGVSKASALEKVRGRLGVTPQATVAVGDGDNDVEMLAWAALGVAMGSAPERVTSMADCVVPGVEHDGVALVAAALLAR